MKYLIFAFSILFSINATSQNIRFHQNDFPPGKFSVSYDTTSMAGFKIVLIVARPIMKSVVQHDGTKVWVQRINDNKLTEKIFWRDR